MEFRLRNKDTLWALVCWLDKLYFLLSHDRASVWIIYNKNEVYNPQCLKGIFKSG
jgi:hypothetical protein